MYDYYQLPLFLADEVEAEHASTPASAEEIPSETELETDNLAIQGILPGFECYFESAPLEMA